MNSHNTNLKLQASRRRAKILREYVAGNSQQAIAIKYGVSRQRIQYMLAKAKDETRSTKIGKERNETIDSKNRS